MKEVRLKNKLWCFIVLLVLIEVVVYRDFIFGENCLLFKDIASDSYNTSFTDLTYKVHCLVKGHLPSWQFHTGLGQNQYAFWLEPISLSIAYLFFQNDIAASFIWIQLAYTFLSGMFLFLFLRKYDVNYYASVFGAILYAFSGYMIAGSTWSLTLFSNEVMLLAFLLLALNYFFNGNKLYLLPIAIALIGISFTPVLLYFASIVTIIFFLFHFSSVEKLKKEASRSYQFVLFGILGMGMACYLLPSNLYQMLQSPRGSQIESVQSQLTSTGIHWADEKLLSTTVLRLFSNNLQGVADNYKGWNNYLEAPFFFTSLAVLLLVPQLFHFVNKKAKIGLATIVTVFVLIGLVPFFRKAVWLFTGDYFRTWSLLFVLGSVIAASFSLHFIIATRKVYLKTLGFTLGVLWLLLAVFQKAINQESSPFTVYFLLAIYSSILFLWQRNSSKKNIIYAFLSLVIFETIATSNPTLTERKIVQMEDDIKKDGFADDTNVLINQLKRDDSTFFRIEKDYFSGKGMFYSYNEALVQNFYGSASYFSFHNVNYISFLKSIDALELNGETGTRFVKGIREIPEVMRICSVKYFISNQDSLKKQKDYFEKINESNGFTAYKIKDYLPFGFTYSQWITEEDFNKLPIQERRNTIQNKIVIEKDKSVLVKDLDKNTNAIISENSERKFLNIKSFSNDNIKGDIILEKPQLLFFSIPFDKGWTITVDKKGTEKLRVFSGLTGIVVGKGKHDIELTYEPPFKTTGQITAFVSLILTIVVLIVFANKNNRKA